MELTIREYLKQLETGEITTQSMVQRPVVYNNYEQCKVINSIMGGYQLPAFYLGENNGRYELIDGLQRTTSIQRFYTNEITYKEDMDEAEGIPFGMLPEDEQNIFFNTKLTFIKLDNTNKQKACETFYRINTCGKALTQWEVIGSMQEDIGMGTNLMELMKKDASLAKFFGDPDVRGRSQIRELKGITRLSSNKKLNDYLQTNKFNSLTYMKLIKETKAELEELLSGLPAVDLTLFEKIKVGIKYHPELIKFKDEFKQFVSTKFEYHANIGDGTIKDKIDCINEKAHELLGMKANSKADRTFSLDIQKQALARLQTDEEGLYICPDCREHFSKNDIVFDHIIPYEMGGHATLSNCQAICKFCNREKSDK